MTTYEIFPICTGSIECDKGLTITLGKDVGRKIRIPSTVYYIRGKNRHILVDTGMCDTEKANKHHYPGSLQESHQRIDKALEKFGITIKDIDTVIFTHLHWDHCQNIELFTHAKLLVQKKELEYAKNPLPIYHNSYQYQQPGLKQSIEGMNFIEVEGDQEIYPGISVITTPGHSPGHQSVVVQTKDGIYVAAGDAIMSWENLKENPRRKTKFTLIGRYQNADESWNSMEKIFNLVNGEKEHILPGHDLDLFKKRSYPQKKLKKEEMKYAIIGCGTVGKVHVYHFKEQSISIVGFCDTSDEQLRTFQETFGKINTYKDYKEMIEKEKPNVVSICTPPNLHKEQVLYCAEKGINIICEKPIATNIEDLKEMIAVCSKNDVAFGIMLPRRYYNNSRAAKKAIAEKAIGELKEASFNLDCFKGEDYYSTSWRGKKDSTGGGILMSQSIHSIDQLLYILGKKPKAVMGRVRTTRSYLEIEDEAEAKIIFEDGFIARIKASANTDRVWQGITNLKGEKGLIVLDSAKTLVWEVPEKYPFPEEEKESISHKIKPIYYGPGHNKVIEDFVISLEHGERPYVEAESSLDAMKIITGIYESSDKGGVWINIDEEKNNQTNCYIFDLFETLIDGDFDYYHNNLISAPFGLDLNGYKEQLREFVSLNDFESKEQALNAILNHLNIKFTTEQKELFFSQLEEWKKTLKLSEGAIELLQKLRSNGVKLALISNNNTFLEELIDKFEVKEYFDVIILSHKDKVLKPSKEIYNLCTQKLNSSVHKTTMIGDQLDKDVIVPQELGMQGILFDPNNKHPNYQGQRIKSLRELIV